MKHGKKIGSDGVIRYYKDGNVHREDGPSFIFPNGDQNWHQNNFLHREDGPAIIRREYNEWWIHGNIHREDGPALEWIDNEHKDKNMWYINGVQLTETQFLEWKIKNLLK